jgi:drug/metabolite transporter (DMT)-like permease
MIGIILALLSAFTWGFSIVLIRNKMDELDYFLVTLIITIIGNIILWPIALTYTNLKNVNFQDILFFVIAGLLSPGITRLFYFKGMEALGVSINAAIFATYPLYTTILAIPLLGEIVPMKNWSGVMLILIGIILIERNLNKLKIESRMICKKSIFLPLFATLTNTFSWLVRKKALIICNEPLLGVTIGYFVSLLLYISLLIPYSKRHFINFRKGLQQFWKPSILHSIGWVFSFYALNYEKVSIVTPLIDTEPLFTLYFAHIYLKGREYLSFRIVLGTILIVIGVMLVSMR